MGKVSDFKSLSREESSKRKGLGGYREFCAYSFHTAYTVEAIPLACKKVQVILWSVGLII